MRVPTSFRVLKWLFSDLVRKYLLPLAAEGFGLLSRVQELWDSRGSLGTLLKAHRYRPTQGRAERIKKVVYARPDSFGGLLGDEVGLRQAAIRSIVLRPPAMDGDAIRPGVILLKFTDTSRYYAHHVDIQRLQELFCVVLEPSWAGYAIPEILFWARAERPVVVESSEISDRELLHALNSNLVPVPFGSSDWVNHHTFSPLGLEKEYDAVYVANYSPGKRTHVFFKALRTLKRRSVPFRAALVSSPWGGTKGVVEELVDYYGVRDVLDTLEGLNQPELNTLLNRSKCNILLSLKEGSNRSLFEAMFAGTPGILLANNVGVNKDYIHSKTGILASDQDLPDALEHMSKHWREFDSRAWAMANIAPEVTTRKLSRVLEGLNPSLGPGAFNDLLVKTNAPEAVYFKETGQTGLPVIPHPDYSEAVLRLLDRDQAGIRASAEIIARLESLWTGVS